jgi:microcystin-dependent protein
MLDLCLLTIVIIIILFIYFFYIKSNNQEHYNNDLIEKEKYYHSDVIGSIRISAVSNFIPTGYLLCDGSSISKEKYSLLYSIIGDTYNTNNDDTMFQLPDLRGVSVLQYQKNINFNSYGNTLGLKGGSDSYTLIDREMPAHSHYMFVLGNQPDIGKNYVMSANDNIDFGFLGGAEGRATQLYDLITKNKLANEFYDLTIDNTKGRGYDMMNSYKKLGPYDGVGRVKSVGEGKPFNIMNPYIILKYIIYTGIKI